MKPRLRFFSTHLSPFAMHVPLDLVLSPHGRFRMRRFGDPRQLGQWPCTRQTSAVFGKGLNIEAAGIEVTRFHVAAV